MVLSKKIFPFVRLSLLGMALAAAVPLVADNDDFLDPMIAERVPLLTEDLQRDPVEVVSYAHVLRNAKPAVVSVHTSRVVQVVRGGVDPRQEFMRRFFGLPPMPGPRGGEGPTVEERKLPEGMGSGVIVSSHGYILTNNHVIAGRSDEVADEILVRLNDERELPARVVGRDSRTDVAVLKIDAEDLPYLPIADSNNLVVGDIVFAIGNPMGVGMTVTQGIVSATGRGHLNILGDDSYENFIQTDAAINMGNSGGALIDAKGRLVGINTAILSRTGGSIGIGFAIPSAMAHSILVNLATTGTIRRGFLGVSIGDITDVMAEAFGLPDTRGVLIQDVEEGLPADESGIRRGDVVLEFNGRPVRNANDFRLQVAQTPPGTAVDVTVQREGERKTLEVVLGDLEEAGLTAGEVQFLDGVTVGSLTPERRDDYRIPTNVEGVVITAVEPRSPFARTLREGMVLVELNDRPVETVADARRLLRRGANKLYIFDRGRFGYLAVRN
ncbi:MAG: Do family serine endopeptidase [Opitutales bacterium]|nr:Do family serine endopeptidase [Opitutales bacterium]